MDETGLYDYHARLYDPVLGRFISADTVVPNPSNPQDLNRYSYVRNNPVRFTDASGHQIDFGGGDVLETPTVHVCGNCIANYIPPGFAPYQFPVGFTPDGGGTYVAVTQGPSLWNAYVGLVGKRIQSLNSQGADPDFINSEFKRYMGYDLFPADILALGQPAASPTPPAAPQSTSSGTASSLGNFALGFIPGYDLGQALGNPDAGLGDYFLGVLGVVPGAGKGASAGIRGLGNISGGIAKVEDALAGALRWLGVSYKEIDPGVFRSTVDPSRQFRMTTNDLLSPKQGPHVHFESVGPDGRTIVENSHVIIK